MKPIQIAALSMLAGVSLGAIAIQGLHAQAKPPVYAIVVIDEIFFRKKVGSPKRSCARMALAL